MAIWMEKQFHTVPVKSWDELEWVKSEINSWPEKMSWWKWKTAAITISLLTLFTTSCDSNKSQKDKIYDAYNAIENAYFDAKENTASEKADVKDAEQDLREEKTEEKNAIAFESAMKNLRIKAERAWKTSDLDAIEELESEIKILEEQYNQ